MVASDFKKKTLTVQDVQMVAWFGEDYTPTTDGEDRDVVLYHADANRVDICMRHMDRFCCCRIFI